jgi:hypothetical protein
MMQHKIKPTSKLLLIGVILIIEVDPAGIARLINEIDTK